MEKKAIAYWLIPAAPARGLFRELIGILAKQFGAPQFLPHLTLLVHVDRTQRPNEILKKIRAAPLELRIRKMASSPEFTKTLFVRLEPNRQLAALSRALRLSANAPPKLLRDPHISLLYKKMPARVKRELAKTIRLPMLRIRFDAIKAVRCKLPSTTGRDVRQWKVVATKSLR